MWLNRVTPDPFNTPEKFGGQRSAKYRLQKLHLEPGPGEVVVATPFPRYGGGSKNQSDYEVCVQWSDAEAIIDKFCEAGHPAALAMREGRRLVEIIQSLPRQVDVRE